MVSSTILIVGYSHTVAVRNALATRNRHWAAPEWLNVRVLNLREFMPTLGLTVADVTQVDSQGPPHLHPEILGEIERQTIPDSRVYVASMVGRNVHNIFGLMRADVPFDFVLPEAPDLPIEGGAQLIPYAAMTACLERHLGHDRSTLEALRRQFPRGLVHLESPPPPRDDEYVTQHLGAFRTLNASGHIVSAALRFKLWRLYSTIMRRFCQELGIVYVPSPIETRDAHGFLARQAYGDATHGNPWYGSRLLLQLEALVMVDQCETAA